jgi:hypothetical protein
MKNIAAGTPLSWQTFRGAGSSVSVHDLTQQQECPQIGKPCKAPSISVSAMKGTSSFAILAQCIQQPAAGALAAASAGALAGTIAGAEVVTAI